MEDIKELTEGQVDFNLMIAKTNEIVRMLKAYGMAARIGTTPEGLPDTWPKAGPADVEKT